MVGIDEVLRDEPARRELEELTSGGAELRDNRGARVPHDQVRAVIRGDEEPGGDASRAEAVVRSFMRPVCFVRRGRVILPRSGTWRTRLSPVRARLDAAVASVGRVEFVGHPGARWGGTAWVVDDRTVVTNRHVVEAFAERIGSGWRAKIETITGAPYEAHVDFREEHRQPASLPPVEVEVEKILFVAPSTGPDLAFLRLAPSTELPAPLPVLEHDLADGAEIAVIGYPAEDPDAVPSEEVEERLFGGVFGVKRVSPGLVLINDAANWWFTHDATTLGGSSGSAVVDLATGAVAGVHFRGQVETANYAVKASVLREQLAKANLRSSVRVPPPVPRGPGRATPAAPPAAVADYAGRTGYDPDFLGDEAGLHVPLPVKTRDEDDVLRFTVAGGEERIELEYEHFSVAMSASRRLCLWSAVNIDGGRSFRGVKRPRWRADPRIPRDAQTIGDADDPAADVYGDEPRFARGHMTRREDPIWGANREEAELGGSDSMHLTNAVPQMQPFNAGIWLDLEDYALQNTRRDRMRVSVFTGPILRDDDPVRFATQIPVDFYKVIAFIHDETGELCATGYTMSQKTFLQPEEFVFGEHESRQTRISSIERRTGLSFGALKDVDPFEGDEVPPVVLTVLSQIRFV